MPLAFSKGLHVRTSALEIASAILVDLGAGSNWLVEWPVEYMVERQKNRPVPALEDQWMVLVLSFSFEILSSVSTMKEI